MSTLLFYPGIEDFSLDYAKPFTILIAYEDAVTLVRAQYIFQHLSQELGDDLKFECFWVKFDELKTADFARRAANSATQADLVVFSAHAGRELPDLVKEWIEIWLPGKNYQESALVALVGLPDDQQRGVTPIHVYLSEVAERAHMDFLSQVVKAQNETLSYSPEKITERAQKSSPTIEDLLHLPPPPPHWGINE
ncbi:MAG: hypothetical protein AAB466_13515 [Verrucomicrobiota bacterium]